MATRTSEAILRVRAKDLATKDLRQVASELDTIADNQKKNASSASLATRALRELKDEQQAIAVVARELNRRGGIIGNLQQTRQQVAEAAAGLGRLRSELAELQRIKASGQFVGDIDKAIRNVERSIKRANTELDRQTRNFKKAEAAAAKIDVTYENSADTLREINAQLDRTEKLSIDAAKAAEHYDAALEESKQALAQQEQQQKEITAEAIRRNEVERQAAAQRRREAAQRAAELREQMRIRAELTQRFLAKPAPVAAAAPVIGPTRSPAMEAAARENAIRERLINVLRRQKDAGARLLEGDRRLAEGVRRTTAELDRNSRSLDRNNRATGLLADTGRKSLSVYQRMRGQLLSMAAAYIGFYQAINLVRGAIRIEQQRKGIEIQLKVANNDDPKAAARDLKFLREEANRLGLVFEDVAESYANFKIAASAAGAANRTTRKAFSESLEIVTALRLSADDAQGVFRAFVQVLGKGKVMAEELRQQLGDRLPGAVAKFAESQGIALSQLDKWLKSDENRIEGFFKFLESYNAQVKAQVAESSNTLIAQTNRLKNSWNDFLEQFAKAGTSSKVREIVDELIKKLSGEEGKQFAYDLANGFAVVGKSILWVIENFETLIKVVKGYLALNLAKAFFGLGSALAVAIYRLYAGAKAMVAFTAATNAARLGVGKMTTSMKVMMAFMGPLGVALGAVALGFYASGRAARSAAADTDRFIGQLQRLRFAQGEQLRSEARAALSDAKALGGEIAKVQTQLNEARSRRDSSLLGGVGDAMDYVADAGRETGVSVQSLTERLAVLRTQQEGLYAAATKGFKRYKKEKEEELAANKALAEEQDRFQPPTPDEDDDGKAKKAADAAERLAERRRDIADRAAKAILEIEKDLSEARLGAEVTTQAQIEANTKERLAIIDADIQKRVIDLENLKRDAQRIGADAAVADANASLAKLPALRQVLQARVLEDAIVDSIRLKEEKVNALIAQRDAEIQHINTLVELGLLTEVEGRQQAIDKQKEYRDEILSTIDDLVAALQALPPDLFERLGAGKLIADLKAARAEAEKVQTTVELIGKKLGGEFATGAAAAFSTFIRGATGGIEGVNGIADAFKNASNSFLEFLANFLVGIGEAILQAILLKAIMNALTGGTGGYMDAAVGALTGHTGGVVKAGGIGSGNPTRSVSAAVFAGAQYFHDGGLPGLKPNEVPAILKKKEEVLTEDDPRNVLNGGLSPAPAAPTEIAIYNTIESSSMVAKGLDSRQGRKALVNAIQADLPTFKKMLVG
jgi:tape measure domain-containing protein